MTAVVLPCPVEECEHTANSPMQLGLHKRRAHGIAGAGDKKRRPAGPDVSADRPPRSPRRASSGPRAPRPPKIRYAPALTQYASMIGLACSAMGAARNNPNLVYDGQIIVDNAEAWALSWERLAANDPKVARVLDLIVSSSQWGEVATTTLAVLIPIAACHGLIPAPAAAMFGAPEPPDPPARKPRAPRAPKRKAPPGGNESPVSTPNGTVPFAQGVPFPTGPGAP